MAQFEQKQPQKRRRDQEGYLEDPVVFDGHSGAHLQHDTSDADQTLGNIDDAPKGNDEIVGNAKKQSELDREGLKDEEANPIDYTPTQAESTDRGGVRGFLWGSRRRKQTTVGFGILGGGLLIGSIFLIFISGTIRIVSFVTNAELWAGSKIQSALSTESDKVMQNYIVKKVIPGMAKNKCRSTRVSKSCALVTEGSSPIAQLYNAWRSSNFENKLADKYDFEIFQDGRNNFFVRSPNFANDIELGHFNPENTVEFEGKAYQQLSRTEVRAEAKRVSKDATKWDKLTLRFGRDKLLEAKYGIKRCLAACTTRDRFTDSVVNKKVAFNLWLNEHVITPRSEYYGLVVKCALASFDCTKNKTPGALAGESTTDFDRELTQQLADARVRLGSKLDDLAPDAKELQTKGFTYFLVKQVTNKATAELAAKAVPVIGWVDFAATLENSATNIGPAMQVMSYSMNAATATQVYMLYSTSASEVKAGVADQVELGSVIDSLNASTKKDQGGVAGEQNTLYQKLFNNPSALSLALSGKTSSTTAYAFTDGVSQTGYQCDDNTKTDDTGTCPEEKINASGVVGDYAKWFSAGVKASNPIAYYGAQFWSKTLGSLWNKAVGLAAKYAMGALRTVLDLIGLGGLLDKATQYVTEVVTSFVGHLIPSAMTNATSGARYVAMGLAGADNADNLYAHYGLGGRKLTDAESLAMQTEQFNENQKEFAALPLTSRLFSTDNPQSLISQFAINAPTNVSSAASLITSGLHNSMMNLFSVFFPASHAVSNPTGKDPFAISQYGLTSADIDKIGDQDAYWNANCTDINIVNAGWAAASTRNDETGQYDNSTPNYCMFIQSSAMALGGLFDSKLLPVDDQSGTGGGGEGTGDPPNTAGWTWPLSLNDWSGPFGYNVWGSCGVKCRHEGVDLSGTGGDTVLAAHDGKVVSKEYVQLTNGACKWQVLIQATGTPVWYAYQHMQSVSVNPGDEVKAGDKVGIVDPIGPTGDCGSGAHLHFSIEKTAHVSSYAEGAGKSDKDMPSYPPLCFLDKGGRTYGADGDKTATKAFCASVGLTGGN